MHVAAAAALLIAAPLFLAPVAARAGPTDVAGARAFVTIIYRHYPTPDGATPWDWQQRRIYDAGLAALVSQDIRLANGDEPAWMDADVFCQCQDPGGLTWRIASVIATGPASAKAQVDLTFGADQSVLEIDLTRTARGWRVHDIVSTSEGSWRRNLAQAVAHPDP